MPSFSTLDDCHARMALIRPGALLGRACGYYSVTRMEYFWFAMAIIL